MWGETSEEVSLRIKKPGTEVPDRSNTGRYTGTKTTFTIEWWDVDHSSRVTEVPGTDLGTKIRTEQ